MKKNKTNGWGVVLIILAMFTIIFLLCINRNAIERFKDCEKRYPWWEMVQEECGYDKEKDQKNDYCRGFGDGYDYYIGIKQSDY